MNSKFLIIASALISGGLSYAVSNWYYTTLEEKLLSDKERLIKLNYKKDVVIAHIRQQHNLAKLELNDFKKLTKNTPISLISLPEKNVVNSTASFQVQQCHNLIGKIDFPNLEKLSLNAESNDFAIQQRALKVLALIGSPEEKEKVRQVIANEKQDIDLRRELIRNTDWSEIGAKPLVELFQSNTQSNVRTDIIGAAQLSSFSVDDKVTLENTLINNFSQESNDLVKIATLDYFANTNQAQLKLLVNTMDKQALSQDVKTHLQTLEVITQ